MKKNVALVGCGYWGKHFLRLCLQHTGITLVGVYDSSPERVEELRKLHTDVQFYNELDQLLKDSAIEAVIVCTGLSSHFAIAQALLKAGKHVLCEKPLTITATESTQLGAMAQQQGVVLMVGHTFEYNSAVLFAKQAIENGSLGTVHYLSFRRCGNGPIRTDADVVYDLATHDISIANLLLGSVPHQVSATGQKIQGSKHCDAANITLVYPKGPSESINVSWLELVKQREMKVLGSNGMLLFNDVVPSEKIRLYHKVTPKMQTRGDFGDFQLSVSDHEITIPQIHYKEPLREELQHFLDCIAQTKQPNTGYQSAVNVVKVLEAIEQSIVLNGQPINVAE
jgi:predicted dehydrogenase